MRMLKQLVVASVIGLACLSGAAFTASTAHADDVQCHCSGGLALWCEDLDTGESWQATNYNSTACGGNQ
jgi:hypothetical protein